MRLFARIGGRKQPVRLALVGLCGGISHAFFSAAAAEAPLPVVELSALHRRFGGDSSVWDNQPMLQSAPSGGTISALSVQIPALEKLLPYLRLPGCGIFDLGFGSGVMTAMMLAVADDSATAVGVDLADKVPVATGNMESCDPSCPFSPFDKQRFSLEGGDAFAYLSKWKKDGKRFDVVYSGCSMDPRTEQLRL
ncbi:FAL1, partial [Symbiodinium sp. CCMP2592]